MSSDHLKALLAVLVFATVGPLLLWLGRGGGCGRERVQPPQTEHRCDYPARRDFVLQCVRGAGSAGDSDGVAEDCDRVAYGLFCDAVTAGRSRDGKAWQFRDGQWRLRP